MIGFRSHKKARAPRWRIRPKARTQRGWVKPLIFSAAWAAAWAVAVPTYLRRVRPWMLTWGATPEEVAAPWPGDELIPNPRHVWMRAVTVDAPPASVWPWLVQMGQGRGGLYSYDWLENIVRCDIHSLSYIDPAMQQLAVGDAIRLVPEEFPVDLHLIVTQLEPQATLVLVTPGSVEAAMTGDMPYMSWGFYLRPTPDGKTRLVARTRAVFKDSWGSRFTNDIALEPVQFIMERKMLLGIKRRAEQLRAVHTESV